jgi:hypothetical protein
LSPADCRSLLAPCLILVAILRVLPAWAQTTPAQADGPPAPIAPLTVSRSDDGRVTIRAVRIAEPLQLDGHLDEEVYSTTPAIDGFVQQLPVEGVPATEPTDLWVFFDDDNLYIAARCYDSQPERVVGNELRRDNGNIFGVNDNFSVSLDTFHDRRNGFYFQTNPIGALRDQAITDGVLNVDWNTVWDVKAVRSDIGYTLEMRIPFKSLRYRAGGAQTWGMNVRRVVRWKNEVSNLTQIPASYSTNGVAQMAVAATLVGLEAPAQSMNLELKPYATSSVITDRTAAVPLNNDVDRNIGFDLKYGLSRGLTADLTVNTDFAQVEEDEQQINLTRFNLFFPEKRDFFLEGQGIFDFGGQSGQRASQVNPILFFSRRIGLSNGQSVPVIGGGRVTGKAGLFDVGALAITTDDKPSAGAVSTTFSAVRVRRNILRRSSVGFIATGRWPAAAGSGNSGTAGIDAYLRFFQDVEANLYWARTSSPGTNGADASYRARFDYGGDRYGLELDRVVVESNFNPEVGFVRRTDFAMSSVSARFSPRLARSRLIRRLNWQNDLEYIANASGDTLQDRTLSSRFAVEFNSSDQIVTTLTRRYERLPLDFVIATGVVVPAGGYSYDTLNLSYALAQQRKLSGTLSASHGGFYEGTRTSASYRGRVSFSPHVGLEPNVALNWVRLPYGDFTARLVGLRLALAPTARLGFSALTQFNPSAHSLTSSARMRWEYTPGSELFVVYSDGRDTATAGVPSVQNRTLAVKVTRLLRF